VAISGGVARTVTWGELHQSRAAFSICITQFLLTVLAATKLFYMEINILTVFKIEVRKYEHHITNIHTKRVNFRQFVGKDVWRSIHLPVDCGRIHI